MDQRSQEVPILQPFQIRTVQRELRLRGFRVEANGVWDETTRDALAQYQSSRGLRPTGQPDLATLWKLGVDPDPMYNCEMNNTVDCSPSRY
jgi:peptidoglycan hydrolase-like protein with peptidoglycan-binding domain